MDVNTAITAGVGTVVTVIGAIAGLRLHVRKLEAKAKVIAAETDASIKQAEIEMNRVVRKDGIDEVWDLNRRYREIIESNAKEVETLRRQMEVQVRQCEEREAIAHERANKYENVNARIIERVRLMENYIRKRVPDWPFDAFDIDPDASSGHEIILPPEDGK